jgi:glucose/arabinose dehydrogenase
MRARRTEAAPIPLARWVGTAALLPILLAGCRTAGERDQIERVDPGRVSDQVAPVTPGDADGLLVAAAINNTVRPERRDVTGERVRQLQAPDGFRVVVWARNLEQPRGMVAAPNGFVYVAERKPGRVTVLRDRNGDGEADHRQVVASGLGEGLQGVHGLAVHQNRLYMVTETELYVADMRQDGSLGEPRLITDDIPAGGQHPNRTMGFGPDGQLYLSIGSTCNACVEPMEEHATIVRVNLENGERTIYAEGLRNTIGFGWHPQSQQLWGLDHNSDGRGDNWPPEELNRIREGRHYGWPWCGGDREIDWQIPSEPEDMPRAAFCAQSEPPVLTYQGHAAPMQMVFYTASAFPAEYRNDAFATMRGSWNRNPPVGYEVVRIRFDQQGNPTEIEPFVRGWLLDGGRAHFGRLMGIAQTPDGSLLVGDDENGVIYRVSYRN